jgi:GNAT superfamily N-acetyltransferase
MSRPLVGVLLFRLQEARRVLGDVEQAAVLARWLIRREYLVTAKDLREGLPTAPPVDGVRWRPLDDADIPLVVATRPTLGEAEVRHRLAEAQQCWVGWVGTRPVHWRWEADADVFLPYLGRRLRPNPGERWVVDVYTDPAYRGRGLYTASTALALQRAREHGRGHLLGIVASWNRPARHVMQVKVGRKVIGAVGYWQTGPWRRYFASGAVRFAPDGAIGVDGGSPSLSRPGPPAC